MIKKLKKCKLVKIGALLMMLVEFCYGGYFDDTYTAKNKKAIFLSSPSSYGGRIFIEYCLKNGVNLVDDETGVTLLHVAAAEGKLDAIEMLIANGADVNSRAEFGETPLYVAVCEKQIDAVAILIKNKANVDLGVGFKPGFFHSSPLVFAVSQKLHEIAVLLIEAKADISIRMDLGAGGKGTLLGAAVDERDIKMVELLLSSGADPNIKTGAIVAVNGQLTEKTPLTIAIGNDDIEIVKLLVASKADVNERVLIEGIEEVTHLSVAVAQHNIELAKILIDAGADVNAGYKYEYGKEISLLQLAGADAQMLNLLIRAGARKGAMIIAVDFQE